jgi:hypothetical protein
MVGFKFRSFVRLQGLSNIAYNGKLARIESLSADEDTGRYLVELQDASPQLSSKFSVKPENMVRACDCCHQSGAATMQYCGKCKNAAYCNAECQRSDWTRHKIDCNKMSSQRQFVKSPIFLAVVSGNLAEVQKVVREGADVNKALKADGVTPLWIAAAHGHLSVVHWLVLQGADKNKANSNRETPLFSAAQQGQLLVAKYLVQQGVDIDTAGDGGATPFFIAAENGHLSVVQYLAQQGADKTKALNEGTTPLIVASQKGLLSVVQFLGELGAE